MRTESHPPKSNPRILEKSKVKYMNIKQTNIATIFDKRFVNYQSARSTASSLISEKSAQMTLKSKLLKKIQEFLISLSIPESKTEDERQITEFLLQQTGVVLLLPGDLAKNTEIWEGNTALFRAKIGDWAVNFDKHFDNEKTKTVHELLNSGRGCRAQPAALRSGNKGAL